MIERLDKFQRFALLTTFATYLLIAVGGLVRASGAGLGCPDWPKCFDRWIPPLSVADVPSHIDPALFNFAKAWTEYVNRLLGVVVGFLIFWTLVLAIRYHKKQPRILYPTIAAFILVGVEGWIGGKVVGTKLSPPVLTVHLVLAIVIAGALLYATFHAFSVERAKLSQQHISLRRFALAVILIALAQLGLGADLRGEIQLAVHADVPRELWLDSAGSIIEIHRYFAFVTAAAVLALYLWVHRRFPDRRLRLAATASFVLVAGQIATGVILGRYDFPPVAQVLHLWLGTLLLGALMLLALIVDTGPQGGEDFRHAQARPIG